MFIYVTDSMPPCTPSGPTVVMDSLPLAKDGDGTQVPFSPTSFMQSDVVAATLQHTNQKEDEVRSSKLSVSHGYYAAYQEYLWST